MNDDSAPDHSLPLFLSSDVEKTEQRGSSRILKSGLLGLTALAVGGATLLLGGPTSHVTAITASFVGTPAPAPVPSIDAPASPTRPIVEAQAALPTEAAPQTEAAVPNDPQSAAVAPEPAEPKQSDAGVDREALFRQFQAWAQQHDSRQQESEPKTTAQTTREPPAPPQPTTTTSRSVSPRVEPKAAAPAAQAPVRAAQKQRPARELRNARAEVESERRAKATTAQPYWSPTEETRAADTPAQSTDTPWLLRLFGGQHN
ncbi:hypothetical protein [Bradyrhizobium sp. STM 3557]|uniref:hypothetical protein n=1 Tax=Bradyrhizobium sp. STM 3557 TaxID=578920 RepID=UPI00388F40A0